MHDLCESIPPPRRRRTWTQPRCVHPRLSRRPIPGLERVQRFCVPIEEMRPSTLTARLMVCTALTEAQLVWAAEDCCPPHPASIDMSTGQLEAWVRGSAYLQRFAPTLREHEVDGLALALATAQDLMAAGFPLGAALKLKHCVVTLEVQTPPPTPMTPMSPPPPTPLIAPTQPRTSMINTTSNATSATYVASEHLFNRRALQDGTCDPPALEAMLAQCCPSGSDANGHRRAQDAGCNSLPTTCSPACATMYMPFYSACPHLVSTLGSTTEFDQFFDKCQAAQPAPPPPLSPLLPPPPTPSHCVDSTTWVSDIESAGCSQYAPGETSYQAMCAVHRGQYIGSSTALSEGSAQASTMFIPLKVTAAEACPAACGLCPSCDDGRQNGGETGIDCGGSCNACVVVPSCPPIETTGLVGQNMEAVCTGQATGDSCYTRPVVGFRPSTASAALHQCSATSTCAEMDHSQLVVPQRDIRQGEFTCTSNGKWSGEPMQVLPILATVCPPQVVGDHYRGECEGPNTCVAVCDEGYPQVRGDGLFTCQGGVWIGDLVCEPISCGVTLDKASPQESAFTICTDGDTLGSSCIAFCREGFYSSVGTGVGSFECMKNGASEGGLWMQQGFSPWWESSLQCTRCPAIENCHVSSCTTGTDAVCSECAPGFYAFRHDEEPTRCLPVAVTMQAAGFGADAAGLFSFRFSGAVPSDLASGTIHVPPTAALSLFGSGTETIGASFSVVGALTLTNLNLDASVGLETVDGGSLTLGSMEVPLSVLHAAATTELRGVGSALQLATITVPERPNIGELIGTRLIGVDNSKIDDPEAFLQELCSPEMVSFDTSCSGHGTCDTGGCVCDQPYSGGECDQLPCCTVAASYGRCSVYDGCACCRDAAGSCSPDACGRGPFSGPSDACGRGVNYCNTHHPGWSDGFCDPDC